MSAADLRRWSAAQAWEWYRARPWPCGFNYVPSNAISYTEMFLPDCFCPALIDREMAVAQMVGFNCVRVVLPFVVWEHDPAAFKERLAEFFTVCNRRGLTVIPALFDDCAFGPVTDPVYGPQPAVVPGWYANGWTPSPGHALVSDSTQWPRLEKYVTDILTTFRDDRRILAWDLYNEPTNSNLGDATVPLVDRVFDLARAVVPSQPLTVGVFGTEAMRRLAWERSDILTFHNYEGRASLLAEIRALADAGRPILCTEWLNRNLGSTVAECLPLFATEDVGCLHWGLVNGRTQTNLNTDHRPGDPAPPQWQHDLFHTDLTHYDPHEIDLFQHIITTARLRATKEYGLTVNRQTTQTQCKKMQGEVL